MKLSQLRPIIRKLQARRWEKWKGIGGYRKTWQVYAGGRLHQYRATIGAFEILHFGRDIEYILDSAEDKANYAINQKLKTLGLK